MVTTNPVKPKRANVLGSGAGVTKKLDLIFRPATHEKMIVKAVPQTEGAGRQGNMTAR